MQVTGSVELECQRRLENLYIESHKWLLQVAHKVTKQRESAEDLVADLYEYLHIRKNPELFWGDNSYNLLYCSKFLKHRWINKTKKLNRITYVEEIKDTQSDIPYDEDKDIEIQNAYNKVFDELKHLEQTKMWASSKIFSLYWMSEKTLDEVARDIKISKSTVFLSVKKVRKYLEQVIENPFDEKNNTDRN